MTDVEKAKAGYERYGEFVGWKNYAGLPMPKWEDLPEKTRGAWTAVAIEISALTQVERPGSNQRFPPEG